MSTRSAALSIPPLDLDVRVRRARGGSCLTTDCENPSELSVEVSDRRTGKRRRIEACGECRSTALLQILEGKEGGNP